MVDQQTPNEDEDAEGHRLSKAPGAVPEGDDAEGHRLSKAPGAVPDEDDTEGHMKLNKN